VVDFFYLLLMMVSNKTVNAARLLLVFWLMPGSWLTLHARNAPSTAAIMAVPYLAR